MANAEEIKLWNIVNKAILKSLETFGCVFSKDVTRDLLANDVVPVVRCKVCEYAVGHDEIHKTVLCQKRSAYPQQWDEMPFDGFCSYGERKANG